ncbi:MAG TPA: hypothetical protein VFT55_11150, partial [Planctomycetota bacterium]|nr:hypothetical protein [Planctomycetota bacterium]
MTSTRRNTALLGTGIALAACAGAPAPQPVAAGPEMVPPTAITPAAPEKIEPAERPPPLVTKLANGLLVAISASAPG